MQQHQLEPLTNNIQKIQNQKTVMNQKLVVQHRFKQSTIFLQVSTYLAKMREC